MASIKDHNGYNQGFKRTKTFRIRIERRAKMMIAQMSNISDKSDILEIGCGTGEISNFIATTTAANVTGIDICEPFIKIAYNDFKAQNLKYEVKDFLKYDSNSFEKYDYIIGNGILHHLYYNLDDSLSIMRNMLKKDGKIIFMEPNIYNPYCFLIFKFFRKWANLDPEEMAFSKIHIKKILKRTNYTNIKVSYRDFLLPNTPAPIINLVIYLSDIFEKIFPIKLITQSIFISASKKLNEKRI